MFNHPTFNSPGSKRRKAFQVNMSHLSEKTPINKHHLSIDKSIISPMSTTLQSTSPQQSSTFQIRSKSFFLKFKHFLLFLLTHSISTIISFIMSLLMIFINDINILILNKHFDFLITTIHFIILILFLLEFIMRTIAQSGYMLSTICFFDLMSLIGMSLEMNNHCERLAILFFRDGMLAMHMNSKQVNVYVSLVKIVQVMKSTLVVKVYGFIQNVRKKLEVNMKMKELKKMIEEKENRKGGEGNERKLTGVSNLRLGMNGNNSNCAMGQNSNSNTRKNKRSILQSPRESLIVAASNNVTINNTSNNNNNNSLENNCIACTPISFSQQMSFGGFVNNNTNNSNTNNIPSNNKIINNNQQSLNTNPNILSIGTAAANYISNTSQSNVLTKKETIPPIIITTLLNNNNNNNNTNNNSTTNNNNNNIFNFTNLHSNFSKLYDISNSISSRTGCFSPSHTQLNPNLNNLTTTTHNLLTPNPNITNTITTSNTSKRKNSECDYVPQAAIIQLNKYNIYKQRKRIELETESQINKIVTKNISDKSILLILSILLVFPFCNEDNYIKTSNTTSYEYLCEQINHQYELFADFPSEFIKGIHSFIINHNNDWGQHIIVVNHSLYEIYINDTLIHTTFRYNEIAYSASYPGKTYVMYSIRNIAIIISIVNIIRNVCLFIILYVFSYQIFEDTKTNIFTPLEITTNTVNVVSRDPVNFQSLEKLNQSIMNYARKKKTKYSAQGNKYINAQIKTIQFAIIRICKLMAIGFGEAGGQILKDNMNSFEGLNPMIPGKKISGIFGFCLIRNFSQINEVLQEKTILFVNEIASIVHTNVQKFGGVCNKNIGESFLLIWKFNTSSTTKEPITILEEIYSHRDNNNNNNNNNQNIPSKEHNNEQNTPIHTNTKQFNSQGDTTNNNSLTNINPNEKAVLADSAVLSFLAIIKKITKSRISDKYENDIHLQKIVSSSKYKKFKIKMGFGLHVGWGVEGAIGSYHKIDCSYLSPNVNIAARLETATNIYGVEMLLSGEIYNLMNVSLQKKCRLIDCVTLKGSITPVKLYTIDVNKRIPKGKSKHKKITNNERRIRNEYKRTQMYEEVKKMEKTIDVVYMEKSKGMRNLLRNPKSEVFLSCFRRGYDNYVKGNWGKAYMLLKQALFIDWNDGPTNALIKYIEKFECKAPEDWKGYRVLSSKF